jgi:hypothetical protein
MTFIECMLFISESGEKVVEERTFSVTTDKFKYVREPNGEWVQKEIPPPVDNTQYLPIIESKKEETT